MARTLIQIREETATLNGEVQLRVKFCNVVAIGSLLLKFLCESSLVLKASTITAINVTFFLETTCKAWELLDLL